MGRTRRKNAETILTARRHYNAPLPRRRGVRFDRDTPVFLIETDTQLVSSSGAAVLRVAASAEYDGDVPYANKAMRVVS